jgi:outer membrane lipoprotein SlyB
MKAMIALLLAAGLTGCVVAPHSASVYSGRQTQNEQSVRMGTVDSVREVSIANGSSGTGTMAGAALGGLAGSGVGGGKGAVAATIAGAVVGGIIGSNIEADANKRRGVEITVRLDNGDLTAVTQEADEAFRVGERVRLLSSGRTTRVTH